MTWHGRVLVDCHGTKVGTVVDLYVDERDRPARVGRRSYGSLRQQVHLVPIHGLGGPTKPPLDCYRAAHLARPREPGEL